MRTLDATIINKIVNDDPELARAIHHDPSTKFDAQPFIDETDFYIVIDNGVDGAAIFEWTSPGVWEGHSLFAKTCRGKDAVKWGKAFIKEMFEHWGAVQIWGNTPVDNKPALVFNRLIGARSAGGGDHRLLPCPVKYFLFDKEPWLAKHG